MTPTIRLRTDSHPHSYKEEYAPCARIKGIVATAFLALTVVAFALVVTNHGLTFPQDFVSLFTTANPAHLAIGFGVTTLLIGGGAWVVYRAQKKPDPLIDRPIFPAHTEIQDAVQSFQIKKETECFPCYIDTSTLQQGSGKAYIYGSKSVDDHYTVSALLVSVIPFYLVGTVAYHALRVVPIFLFNLGCWLIERCRTQPLFEGQRKFELIDVVREPAKSLVHIVSAPFYATAFLFAVLYSFVNPMGGRELGARIERMWNAEAQRPQGYWLTLGAQKLWARWGELGPDKQGQFKLFVAGCWQPIGVATYNKGALESAVSLSEALESQTGITFEVTSCTSA
ncbi:MAG: hypothetical protein S4CHLAM2_02370 [Chlamydiales bacterium]|nr:hypothetical protein [Chlamydiales bacterium]